MQLLCHGSQAAGSHEVRRVMSLRGDAQRQKLLRDAKKKRSATVRMG